MRRRWQFAAAGIFCSAIATSSSSNAQAISLNLSNDRVGDTPRYVGFNMGHYLPGSNTGGWVEYFSANAFRVWAAPDDYEGADDIAPYGDGVATLADFDARKAAVRADPENTAYINWPLFRDNFANHVQDGRNKVVLNTILGDLTARGVSPILNISRTQSYQFQLGNWGDYWEQWQLYYAMAYESAKNFDVARFQMYNEPDQSNSTITPEEWNQRLKLASDAVRSAVLDVNKNFGKNLVPQTAGPTTKSGSDSFDPWGLIALESNRTDYAGRTVDYDILNIYDLHRYNAGGTTFANDVADLKTLIPQHNVSGQMLPVTFTEFNRRASSSFSNVTDTLDTPAMYTGVASDMIGAMSQGVQGMYAFKFNQTSWDPDGDGVVEPQKTGMYFVNETGTFDTTGSTRGAESVRLFARGFKGERMRLDTGAAAIGTTYDTAASYDPKGKNYYFMGVNRSDTAFQTVTVDVSHWNVAVGSYISVEEVSQGLHGELAHLVQVPPSKQLTVYQPAGSVFLFTVNAGQPQQKKSFAAPVADAKVSRSSPGQNFGHANTATVGRAPAGGNVAVDSVAYFKFDLSSVSLADIGRASLQVPGRARVLANDAADPGRITLHVYAIDNDNWGESGIDYNRAPNLADADTKIVGVGSSAEPVGHLTYGSSLVGPGIDLTDFFVAHAEDNADGIFSFALVREELFAGDADVTDSYVELMTKESGLAAQLEVLLNGTSVVTSSSAAPVYAGLMAAGGAVPEPAGAGLLLIGLGALGRRRFRG